MQETIRKAENVYVFIFVHETQEYWVILLCGLETDAYGSGMG